MVEIINSFDLLLLFPKPRMRSFHLAEGPGGFIEALLQLRYNPQDEYIGMTLLSDNNAVPGWRKSQAFLERHVSVKIERGEDGTGDIMSYQNVLGCANKYGASMDFVTADGGFDFSHDFNHQETQMSSLMLCQVVMATAVQAKGGTFVLKMFDITSKISVQIMYWLSVMYDRVSVIKPYTSRYANSERYIVCQGFRATDGRKEWTVLFMNEFEKFQTHNTLEFIQDEIPQFYLSRVEECNAILGQQQMNTIAATLNLIRNPRQDKIEKLRMANIQKCVNWCQRNKMGFNRDVRQLNMFLSAKSKVSRVPRREEDNDSTTEGSEEPCPVKILDGQSENVSMLSNE
jgi:cap1 methyltransferase